MLTTLNLSKFLLDFIEPLALEAGISIREFVLLCLRRKIREMCTARYNYFCRPVEYQPKGGGYVRVHVCLDWEEYDCNLLCRFVRKFSVSFLAAMAVHELYRKVYEELTDKKKADNYPAFEPFILKIKLTKNDIKKDLIVKYMIRLRKPVPK